MAIDLRNQTILLTGASRGIGVHIAQALAERGAKLVLTARSPDALAETAARCEAAGASVTIVAADLRAPEDRARLIEAAAAPDVLINNAGVEFPKRLVAQTDAEIAAQLELNLGVPIDLTRRALPAMLARGSGTVVNISSMSGKGATPFNSIYAATKYGLNGWTQSLRIELLGTGVHVGVVCPGFVEAGMWQRTGLDAPAGLRAVSPHKVAGAVLKVIGGHPEVLVTPGPIRPFLALRELFPRMEAKALKLMGVLDTLRERDAIAGADSTEP